MTMTFRLLNCQMSSISIVGDIAHIPGVSIFICSISFEPLVSQRPTLVEHLPVPHDDTLHLLYLSHLLLYFTSITVLYNDSSGTRPGEDDSHRDPLSAFLIPSAILRNRVAR